MENFPDLMTITHYVNEQYMIIPTFSTDGHNNNSLFVSMEMTPALYEHLIQSGFRVNRSYFEKNDVIIFVGDHYFYKDNPLDDNTDLHMSGDCVYYQIPFESTLLNPPPTIDTEGKQ